MVTAKDIKQWIEAGLPGSQVKIEGDGHHFEAIIIYHGFDGKTLLQRHRLVYNSLGDKMQSLIHALSMKTYTPEQAQEQNIVI